MVSLFALSVFVVFSYIACDALRLNNVYKMRKLSSAVLSAAPAGGDKQKIGKSKSRPDPQKVLDNFNETADDTIPKVLTLSLFAIPIILGWWISQPTEMVSTPVGTEFETIYDKLQQKERSLDSS